MAVKTDPSSKTNTFEQHASEAWFELTQKHPEVKNFRSFYEWNAWRLEQNPAPPVYLWEYKDTPPPPHPENEVAEQHSEQDEEKEHKTEHGHKEAAHHAAHAMVHREREQISTTAGEEKPPEPVLQEETSQEEKQQKEPEAEQLLPAEKNSEPNDLIYKNVLSRPLPELKLAVLPTEVTDRWEEYAKTRREVLEKKRDIWKTRHPDKPWGDLDSDEEWNKYLHGDPQHPEAPTLNRDVEKAFVEQHPALAKSAIEQESTKVYHTDLTDPVYHQYRMQMTKAVERKVKQAEDIWKKQGSKTPFDREAITKQEELRYGLAFAMRFPKKAEAYAKNDYNSSLKAAIIHLRKQEAIQKLRVTTRDYPSVPILPRTRYIPSLSTPNSESDNDASPDSPEELLQEEDFSSQQPPVIAGQDIVQPRSTGQPSQLRGLPRSLPAGSRRKASDNIRRLAGRGGKSLIDGANSFIANVGKQAAINTVRTNPYIWVALFIAFLIFLLIVVMLLVLSNSDDGKAVPVTIQKSGPEAVENGKEITYTLNVSYPGTAQDIIVTDPIPPDTEFVSASGDPEKEVDANNRVTAVKWSLAKSATSSAVTGSPQQASTSGVLNSVNQILTLTLRPLKNDMYVINQAGANVIPVPASAGGGPISGDYVPPADSSSCGGQYASYIGKNFLLPRNYGDPQCNFNKDKLYTLLKDPQKGDPKFADLWFFTIVPGESGYNPNAWAAPVGVQKSLDASGAWGFYQMGSSKPPGSPPPAPGQNGPLDRGDVNWEIQTSNAIGYNRNQKCSFRYWHTAQSQWGKQTC